MLVSVCMVVGGVACSVWEGVLSVGGWCLME